MSTPNNKEMEEKIEFELLNILSNEELVEEKHTNGERLRLVEKLKDFIISERQLAKEEVLREIWQEILQTDNSRGYRSVAIIDAVKRKASSLGIDLITNEDEK